MLTEKERKWLENRDDVCFRCSKNKRTCSQALRKICLDIGFPIKDRTVMKEQDYCDAAEFEARVSRYIAENASELYFGSNSWQFLDGFKAKSLAWYILWEARIVVEEKMDNEQNHS